jgi:hypothetical protein
MISVTLALLLSQAEPQERISDHVQMNIRHAASGTTAAAIVTVTGADAKTADLHVDEVVNGELPADVKVPAKSFIKCDLNPGTQLLVFFRGKDAALQATGQYELVIDGKIREYPTQVYVDWTRYEIAKKLPSKARPVVAKPAKAASPTGPVSSAAPVQSPHG